ncbi:HelD family protein [Actinocatenispora rupis]|uniref:DNA helicase n=1 Tax=Actinocatenispora rupis TaxID=519421 RepID=A0A8J3IWJ7_9ACTN|nr:AAA family ATPase [Actinocatenispora rupis]GID11306.1 DNA helicase [Actinocatenispora rupis]
MADGAATAAAEVAAEQRHVDRVYARLDVLREETAESTRNGFALARVGNFGALVERDAMVYQMSRRLRALDAEYDGLVFGRLDLVARGDADTTLHIGRLGLRDEQYRPLVVDWRAPAAGAFYRATPTDPMGVIRRRVIRCVGQRVADVQDDLLDPGAAPDGMAVVGEGALLASMARATGHRMRDIVATIAREQDEAVRAPASGAVLLTGGPGTGKTAVALHRAAYLLYSDRNRYESGGVLIVGPAPVFMRYIERVLPSLGEDTVTLRALGEVLDDTSTDRRDSPAVAAVKGSLRMRQVLRRAVRDVPPGAPDRLRLVYAGLVLTLDAKALAGVRRAAQRRGTPHNQARRYARAELIEALWQQAVRRAANEYALDRERFADEVGDRSEFHRFVAAWWPVLAPFEVLSWLGDESRLRRYAGRVLTPEEVRLVAASIAPPTAPDTLFDVPAGDGPTVADVALADELRVLLGPPPKPPKPEPDEYQIAELSTYAERTMPARERPERPTDYDEYAHVVVDEAQDLSPMQWRMVGRRGRYAGWTIVGDPAQSAWPDPDEATAARDEALRGRRTRSFELTTNYRNSAEIFALAAQVVRAAEPDLPLPTAVRHTDTPPAVHAVAAADLPDTCRTALAELLAAVPGTVGVVAPDDLLDAVRGWLPADERVDLLGPLSAKGMEYDGVLVVEPGRIQATAAGGARTLYVVLTRATQRLTVVGTDPAWPGA